MNILVISGGSGNDSLITGLKQFYPDAHIQVLVNAYDNGKSTGVCRSVTGTLGVSDIRKNHIRMYKATTRTPNKSYIEFFENRYDFTKGNEVEEIAEKLHKWNLDNLIEYVEYFFSWPAAADYEYKDFNVANIVYSAMYNMHGYTETHSYFCDLLGIEDFVILNSFDNVFITACTQNNMIIEDEGNIVEWCNPDDKICRIDYKGIDEDPELNPQAIQAIADADLIVISTGTFWSSIFPTIDYGNLYEFINASTAKKVWAINNEEDKDAYGVTSNDFIRYMSDCGLNLNDFVILENHDAIESLRMPHKYVNIYETSMGNNKGKHDGNLYARALLKCYYGVTNPDKFTKVFFDFDDTLWARNPSEALLKTSRDNISLVSKFNDKAVIISGNSYASIANKLSTVYGSSLNEFNPDIWADANAVLFRNDASVGAIESLVISGDIMPLVEHLGKNYGIISTVNRQEHPTFIKLKPLDERERIILAEYLNNYLLGSCGLGYCKAIITGNTTIDIVMKSNDKSLVAEYYECDPENVLYIGDEVDNGNDQSIAQLCGTSIHTSGVQETNVVLRLLLNED